MATAEYSLTVTSVALLAATSLATFGGAQAAALSDASQSAAACATPAGMVVAREAGVVRAVGNALEFYYSNPVTRRVRGVSQRLEPVYRPLRAAYRGTVPGATELTTGDFHFSVVMPKHRTAPAGGWPYVLFAPGILGAGRHYVAIAERLAERGLAVALYDLPRLTEYDPRVRRAWAVEAEDVLRRSALPLDHGRSLGVGHSGGAALMIAARRELRALGIVAIAPGWPSHAAALVREGLGGEIPLVSIGFADDATAPPVEFARQVVASSADRYVELPAAGHNDIHSMFRPANQRVLAAVEDEVVALARRVGLLAADTAR